MRSVGVSTAHVIAVVVGAVLMALLPPLLLAMPALWFIAPPLAVVLVLAVFFKSRWLLVLSGLFVVLALPIAGFFQTMKTSPRQEQEFAVLADFLQAEIYYTRQDYNQALAFYQKAARAGLDVPWVTYQRARCHALLGQDQTAFEIFSRMRQHPEEFPLKATHVDYALTAMKSRHYEIGERAFKEALAYNFKPGYCYYQLGIYYRVTGNQVQAAEMMTRAYGLGYERSETSSLLGGIAESRKDYARAEEYYRRAQRENQENISVYVKLGSFLYRQGRLKEAEEILKTGARMAEWMLPESSRMYAMILNNLGFVYNAEGYFDKAVLSFKQAIRADPTFTDSYDNLSYLYEQRGQISAAIMVMETALQFNPGYTRARRTIQRLLAPQEPPQ